MNPYTDQIEAAVRAVVIQTPTRYAWHGRASPALPRSVERAFTPALARGYLLTSLQTRLYADFYCRGGVSDTDYGASAATSARVTPFLEAVFAANTGRGCWEDGWTIRAFEGDDVVAERDGLTVRARRDQCHTGVTLETGSHVRVRRPKDLPNISPGFYMALGDEPLADTRDEPIVRLYWHLTPEAAVPFVERATATLNGAAVPFRLKVARDPARYTRCDAGVVYVPRSLYTVAAELLAPVGAALRLGLRPAVPALTRRLAPGIGLAEDPAGGESFGLNRCRFIAEGLVRAFEAGQSDLDQRCAAVAKRFAEAGVDIERPFLDGTSSAVYPIWNDDAGHD